MENKTQEIISIANRFASDVIGYASTLITDICDIPENNFLRELTDEELILFMTTYLDRLSYTYKMQLKSISAKIEKNDREMK